MELTTITFVLWTLTAAVALVALAYAVTIYNSLIRLKHSVWKAWSNVDVLLTQRHDALPELVKTCKQCRSFEQEALQRVMEARAAAHSARSIGDVKGVGEAEDAMRTELDNLFAAAETHPELKTSEPFRKLQERISRLEVAIAGRRQFYNEVVSSSNVRLGQFPDGLIASSFDLGSADLLVFADPTRRNAQLS